MLVFFYMYLRPLIEAGKVYKVFTPLYRLEDKQHEFVINKGEMIEFFHKKIRKRYKVKVKGMKEWFDKEDIQQFLSDTYDYRDDLIRVSNNLGSVPKGIVEASTALISLNIDTNKAKKIDITKLFDDPTFIRDFLSNIQCKFKEMNLTGDIIKGVVDGKFCSIKLNNRFMRQMEEFIPIYQKYGYELIVKDGDNEPKEMTIAEFLDDAFKLMPKIKTRYKGLGEVNAKDLYSTALDMNNRISIKFTTEDAEREMEIFRMVHGDSTNDLIKRKEMMMNYHLSRNDLDN